jgi:hypothetical protein
MVSTGSTFSTGSSFASSSSSLPTQCPFSQGSIFSQHSILLLNSLFSCKLAGGGEEVHAGIDMSAQYTATDVDDNDAAAVRRGEE